MIHGVMIFGDKTRISQNYQTMPDFLADVEVEREKHKELVFLSADTVRPTQIRQGRDWL